MIDACGCEKEAMNPSIGIMAGKGSEGFGVGNDTCSAGQVFTMLWIVSKSYFPGKLISVLYKLSPLRTVLTARLIAIDCVARQLGVAWGFRVCHDESAVVTGANSGSITGFSAETC